MEKQSSLDALKEEMTRDSELPLRGATLVFGEGDPHCSVMFIGEAPGFHEDRLGRPFVGRAGKLLDELILLVGWKRSHVYITNIVKRRPPENRDPLPEEIVAYAPYLSRQIAIIRPSVIAPLGRFAMQYFLPEAKISCDQGRLFEWNETKIVPLYHPAAALRSSGVKRELEKAFAMLPGFVSHGEVSLVNTSEEGVASLPILKQLF